MRAESKVAANILFEVDFDKVQSIDDIKKILKALNLGFGVGAVDKYDLKDLIKLK